MKDIWKSGVIILLIIGTLYIIFLRECQRPLPCPAEDEVIIKKATWDSILVLADKPPIVRIDTQWIKGETVYVYTTLPSPTPDPVDTEINHYSDSIVNNQIDVRIDFIVKGTLLERTWQYKPIQMIVTRDSIIYVPKIIIEERLITRAQNGLYGNLIFGGNENAFLFGGGLDWITKYDAQIGYQYQRYGSMSFHSFKLGTRLFGRSTK